MFEKPTVSACRGLILTKAPRFLLNAESSLLLPQDCRAPPSATRTKVPAPRGERRGDPQSGSITAASADQRAPKSRVRWARGRTLVSPSRPGRCRHRRQPAPALRPDGSQRSKARLPTCDTLRCEGPKPLPHNPPQVTPLLPALGLEAASASGQPGLVLSAEAPGLLSSTWGGLCPAPADPAAGPAPARPSPVLIGSCSHPSPLDPPLDPPPTPPEDLPAGNRPRSSPVSGPEPCPGAWFPRGCSPAGKRQPRLSSGRASRQSSLVTVPAVQQAPRRWTRTLHNVDSSQLPVRQSLIKKFKWHLTQGNRTVSCQRM